MNKSIKKIIITGGGTGGHIYPALSIAKELKQRYPHCQLLFVGAEGKMEMTLVPNAGFDIVGLPVAGLQRRLSFKNFLLPVLLYRSYRKARQVVKKFAPDIVIGVGGYASAPTVFVAQRLKIPTLLQEQNSYAGLTNKFLAKKAKKICVAYQNMERYFPASKIVFTGNPVRQDLLNVITKKEEGLQYFGLQPNLPTVLVTGGSLGAGTLNKAVLRHIEEIYNYKFQLLWQVGSYYYDNIKQQIQSFSEQQLKVFKFIDRMDLAYSVADLVVARAGAGTIAELCVAGKATILVPSPNVAEDHQTRNAMALVEDNAAILLPDEMAVEKLIPKVIELLFSKEHLERLQSNILKKSLPNATFDIVNEIESVLE